MPQIDPRSDAETLRRLARLIDSGEHVDDAGWHAKDLRDIADRIERLERIALFAAIQPPPETSQ